MLLHNFKITICGVILWMITGCNTATVVQLDPTVNAQINSVAVINTTGRAGQLYDRALRQGLYIRGKTAAAYDLTSEIFISSSRALSVRGVTSTFKKMTMVANFRLIEKSSNTVVLEDTVTADATLGTVSSLFGQDQSELHARDRMAKLIAKRVVQRLQLHFLEQPKT